MVLVRRGSRDVLGETDKASTSSINFDTDDIHELRRRIADTSEEEHTKKSVNFKIHDQQTLALRNYLRLAQKVHSVVYGHRFGHFILVVICIAGLLVGIATYPKMDENTVVVHMDLAILWIFTIECVMKVMSEGDKPWLFWIGQEWRGNNFDFLVVALCFVPAEAIASNAMLLRLLRLSRLLKLVKAIPALNTILIGLLGGLQSVSYILLLSFLVFYIYSIVGMMLFKGNDPWHFGNVITSLITMMRLSTMEDWTDVMYINVYGCKEYPNYSTPFHSFICDARNFQSWMPAVAVLYFGSFVTLSGLVVFALFIGAITSSMQDAVVQMEMENKKKRVMRNMRNSLSGMETSEKQRLIMAKAASVWKNNGEEDESFWGIVASDDSNSCLLQKVLAALPGLMMRITTSSLFQGIMLGVVVVASVLVGIEIDMDEGLPPVVEQTILMLFTIEVVCKLLAEGKQPQVYFQSGWNVFDFLVVVFCLLPVGGAMLGMVLRLLRILRVLKLIKRLPQLQIMVHALLAGVQSIGFISLLMLLVFYVFGIISLMLFRENDPWHFGSLHIAILTLFRCATLEDWTDIMYINMYGCDEFGYDSPLLEPMCTHPVAQGWLSAAFFVIFVMVASLVMLNLFIGVVTTGIDEASAEAAKRQQVDKGLEKLQRDYQIPSRQLFKYQRIFRMFDMDGGGTIELMELQMALQAIGENSDKNEVEAILQEIDLNNDGTVDLYEFSYFLTIRAKARQASMRRAHVKTTATNVFREAGSRSHRKKTQGFSGYLL